MELLFVYNAKSGFKDSIFNFAHKTINSSSYPCNLCSLTHSNFGQKKSWINFVNKSILKFTFHHIDDFEKTHQKKHLYPVILKKEENKISLVFSSQEINKFKSTQELISALEKLSL